MGSEALGQGDENLADCSPGESQLLKEGRLSLGKGSAPALFKPKVSLPLALLYPKRALEIIPTVSVPWRT